MIYFISDFHLGHTNILRFERNNFKTIEEHDNFIIQQYNKYVKPEDTIYILGDLGAAGYKVSKEYLIESFKKMKYGRKIILLGNHDSYSIEFYKSLHGVVEVYDHPIYIAKRIVLSHEPIQVDNEILNIHGHLHGSVLSLPNYFSVSAHLVKYKPVSYKQILDKLNTIPKDNKKFLYEWYAEYYDFLNNKEGIIYKEDGKVDLEASRKQIYKK